MLDSLRIALVIPENIPAWINQTIENIRAVKGVDVALLIFANPQPAGNAWKTQLNLERKLFRLEPDPWAESSNPLPGTPFMQFSESAALNRLPAFKLDVIVNLALNEYPDIFLQNARFGVWSLHDGRTRFVQQSPIGWYEPFHGHEISTCGIEVARPNHPAQIVHAATFATDMHSIARNQLHFLWKGASRLPYAIKMFMHLGEHDFFTGATATLTAPPESPTNAQLLAFRSKQILGKTTEKLRKSATRDQWGLLIRAKSAEISWEGFQPVSPPRDRLWADPFPYEREGQAHIFVEELLYKKKRGHIACLSLDEDGRIIKNQIVLERPYHLSYPFIFEHRGEFYMLPETSANSSIEVYRCARFPDQWEYHATLMQSMRALDTTLIEHAGRWWMFTTVVEPGHSGWDALHIFYADDPLSNSWKPHPLNPVISDIRSARMAGRLFRLDGSLIRPAQDCSRRYGYAINFKRITTLTTTEYAEAPMNRLEPQGEILAAHTFNFSQNWAVMDMTIRRKK